MNKQHTTLENEIELVTEVLPHVETVFLGVWLTKGARFERPTQNGMFHFIEHVLFKGTPSHSAKGIAEAIEGVGGYLDAYTGKEETCFSLKVRAKHLDSTLTILADMLINPLFDEKELDKERQVILEEIKMEEDNPEDVIYEKSTHHFWKDHSMGHPILGSPENVKQFRQREVASFHREFYANSNMVIAAAGRLNHEALAQRILELFPDRQTKRTPQWILPKSKPTHRAFQRYFPDQGLEQVNFCLNFPGVALADPRRTGLQLLTTLIGGGMSSRLFQKVREERGLAYTIGAFSPSYSDCGHWTIYGGCSPEHFEQIMSLCIDELKSILQNGVSIEEWNRSKEQVISSLVMGLESTTTRASILARYLIYKNKLFDTEDDIEEIETCQPEEALALARDLFTDQSLGLGALGPLHSTEPNTPWHLGLEP